MASVALGSGGWFQLTAPGGDVIHAELHIGDSVIFVSDEEEGAPARCLLRPIQLTDGVRRATVPLAGQPVASTRSRA